MKKNTLILAALTLCLASGAFFAVKTARAGETLPVGMMGYLLGGKQQDALDETLKRCAVPGRETVMTLVRAYADAMAKGKDAGLAKDWIPLGALEYNTGVCSDNWAKAGLSLDGDCRMTAFTLLDTLISAEKKTEDFGSYLVFDIEAMENNPAYRGLLARKHEFISVFNEMNVEKVDENELQNVFPERFKQSGIRVDSDKVSLISLVMHDPEFNLLFVGHAGVMADIGDRVVFFEKLAFEQPYVISVLKTREDLKTMLLSRPEYGGGGAREKGPFVYENGRLL